MKCKLLHSKTREIKVIQNIKFSQNREINMESRKFGACLFEVVSLRIDPHKPHFLFLSRHSLLILMAMV